MDLLVLDLVLVLVLVLALEELALHATTKLVSVRLAISTLS